MRLRTLAVLTALLIGLPAIINAAEPWKYHLDSDLTLTQSYYTR